MNRTPRTKTLIFFCFFKKMELLITEMSEVHRCPRNWKICSSCLDLYEKERKERGRLMLVTQVRMCFRKSLLMITKDSGVTQAQTRISST